MANDVWHALAVLPVVVGARRFILNQSGSPAWWFLWVYGGLLVLAPFKEPRYAWPMMPFIALWLITGLQSIVTWISRFFASRPVFARAAPALLVAMSLAAMVRLAMTPAPPSLQSDPPTIDLFEHLRQVTGPDGTPPRVVFVNPRVLTLLTGVSAMGVLNAANEVVLSEIEDKSISHVVVSLSMQTRPAERILRDVVATHPNRFTLVYENPRYELYRVRAPVPPAG
jgi:hypothetical protein